MHFVLEINFLLKTYARGKKIAELTRTHLVLGICGQSLVDPHILNPINDYKYPADCIKQRNQSPNGGREQLWSSIMKGDNYEGGQNRWLRKPSWKLLVEVQSPEANPLYPLLLAVDIIPPIAGCWRWWWGKFGAEEVVLVSSGFVQGATTRVTPDISFTWFLDIAWSRGYLVGLL